MPRPNATQSSSAPRTQLDRRDFVAGVTAASAAALLPGTSQAMTSSPAGPKIIDCHQHLWDLDRFRLPWTDGNEKLAKNFLIPEYQAATKGIDIAKAIYMEVGLVKEQQVAEAEWVLKLCKDDNNSTVAATIAGQPFEDSFKAYVKRFRDYPAIKGMRHLLQVDESPEGMCRAAKYQAGVNFLGDSGLRFDLCMRPGELWDGLELVKACPNTKFVLDHCGNADPAAFGKPDKYNRKPNHDADDWRRAIEALGKQERLICKISGIIARVAPDNWSAEDLAPIVNHCLDSFGPDRVVFSSDWPVCNMGASLKAWIAALQEIVSERPQEEQDKLFSGNATRFYELA